MLDDQNALLQRLYEVFDGVTLEDGIGLMEALEIDSHSSMEVSEIARNGDEKKDWKLLTADRLRGTFAGVTSKCCVQEDFFRRRFRYEL